MDQSLNEQIIPRQEVVLHIINSLIDYLNIPFTPDEIHPDAVLFGSGLGLDSIDALEVVMIIEREFGVSIEESDIQPLRTINTLAEHVLTSRTGFPALSKAH